MSQKQFGKKMTKKYLFIIDPQVDFIEGGLLPVPDGKKALQRIVDSGILGEDWERIIVTLDSHNPGNLGFGEPRTELRKHLERNTPRPCKWPPHCIIDTPGWEIYGPLQDVLLGMGDKVDYITKGESDVMDSYSFCDNLYGGQVIFGDLPGCVSDIFREMIKGENIEIYWTGLAEDYCVKESIWSIMIRDTGMKIKHILLKDMTSHINGGIRFEGENFISKNWRS